MKLLIFLQFFFISPFDQTFHILFLVILGCWKQNGGPADCGRRIKLVQYFIFREFTFQMNNTSHSLQPISVTRSLYSTKRSKPREVKEKFSCGPLQWLFSISSLCFVKQKIRCDCWIYNISKLGSVELSPFTCI